MIIIKDLSDLAMDRLKDEAKRRGCQISDVAKSVIESGTGLVFMLRDIEEATSKRIDPRTISDGLVKQDQQEDFLDDQSECRDSSEGTSE